jgi:hypothetical protein
MAEITIDGQPFEVVPGKGKADQDAYVGKRADFAKSIDRPVERFVARLGNVSPEDKATAIAAFVQRKDWDEPPRALVCRVAASRVGTLILASMVLRPAMSAEALDALITEANFTEVDAAIRQALAPPSDEAILQANEALKERIRNAK